MTNDDDKESHLSKEDIDLWAYVTRNDKIRKGRAVQKAAPNIIKNKPPPAQDKQPTITNLTSKESRLLEEGNLVGIDKRTAERIRKGKLPIEAHLDLHGHTQIEAYTALKHFITTAHIDKKRCVLVITGYGSENTVSNRGIIRKKFPQWLNSSEIRGFCLGFVQARPEHGGKGAFYVLLKKKQ